MSKAKPKRRSQRQKSLAIVVPVKDREAYLEVFLDCVPRYLEAVNGIHDYKIFVAEQRDDMPFNAGLARNVGAVFALAERRYDYLIFHDVDLIPVSGIDYGYRDSNVSWFLNAGTCKILPEAFSDANGYNPTLWGWTSEDYEFYHRLRHFGHSLDNWTWLEEARRAVLVNLELPPQSAAACLAFSKRYFDHDGKGPRHISYNLTKHVRPREQPPKSGWRIKNWHFHRLLTRHRKIVDFLVRLPLDVKREYASLYGANWVNKSKITIVKDSEHVTRLSYRWFDVVD